MMHYAHSDTGNQNKRGHDMTRIYSPTADGAILCAILFVDYTLSAFTEFSGGEK